MKFLLLRFGPPATVLSRQRDTYLHSQIDGAALPSRGPNPTGVWKARWGNYSTAENVCRLHQQHLDPRIVDPSRLERLQTGRAYEQRRRGLAQWFKPLHVRTMPASVLPADRFASSGSKTDCPADLPHLRTKAKKNPEKEVPRSTGQNLHPVGWLREQAENGETATESLLSFEHSQPVNPVGQDVKMLLSTKLKSDTKGIFD